MFFLYHQEIGFVKENLARVKKLPVSESINRH